MEERQKQSHTINEIASPYTWLISGFKKCNVLPKQAIGTILEQTMIIVIKIKIPILLLFLFLSSYFLT